MLYLLGDLVVECSPERALRELHGDPEALRAGAAERVRRWRQSLTFTRDQAYPAPEVFARPAAPSEIPVNGVRLAKKALAAGWGVSTIYSRGTKCDARGKPLRVIDAVTVRCRRAGVAAVACYENGYVGDCFWREPGQWPRKINVTQLEAML